MGVLALVGNVLSETSPPAVLFPPGHQQPQKKQQATLQFRCLNLLYSVLCSGAGGSHILADRRICIHRSFSYSAGSFHSGSWYAR